jgi:glutathione synthase/RimK-type ligase-like ATP-grasp enzyme
VTSAPPTAPPNTPTPSLTSQVNLLEVDIVNENAALNVMVGFLGLAQKRGVFAINESAKIYECIQKFQGSSSNK